MNDEGSISAQNEQSSGMNSILISTPLSDNTLPHSVNICPSLLLRLSHFGPYKGPVLKFHVSTFAFGYVVSHNMFVNRTLKPKHDYKFVELLDRILMI